MRTPDTPALLQRPQPAALPRTLIAPLRWLRLPGKPIEPRRTAALLRRPLPVAV